MTDLSQIVGVVVEKQKIMGGDGFTVSYMYIYTLAPANITSWCDAACVGDSCVSGWTDTLTHNSVYLWREKVYTIHNTVELL